MEQIRKMGWALDLKGHPVHITRVEKGRACNCICPECKRVLVAKKGKIITHHFAHDRGEDDCPGAAETALHLAAKEMLKTLKGRILIPEQAVKKKNWSTSKGGNSQIRRNLDHRMTDTIKEFQFPESTVDIEPKNWLNEHGFQPDAALGNHKGKLLVEILVTHDVDKEKRNKIRKTGLGSVEINLSDVSRNINPRELEQQVKFDAPRTWITTSKAREKSVESRFDKLLQQESSCLNDVNLRELTNCSIVKNCPIEDKSGLFPKTYDHCMHCENHRGTDLDFRDTPLWGFLDDQVRSMAGNFVFCANMNIPDRRPTWEQKKQVGYLAFHDLRQEKGLGSSLPAGWEEDLDFCSGFIEEHPSCSGCGKELILKRDRKNRLFWECPRSVYTCGNNKHIPFTATSVLGQLLALHDQNRG